MEENENRLDRIVIDWNEIQSPTTDAVESHAEEFRAIVLDLSLSMQQFNEAAQTLGEQMSQQFNEVMLSDRGSFIEVGRLQESVTVQDVLEAERLPVVTNPTAGFRFSLDGLSGRNLADAKATNLLLDRLTPEQEEFYFRKDRVLESGASGFDYRLDCNYWQGNITVYKDGQKFCCLCATLADFDYPLSDQILAQLLMIRTNEKGLWQAANLVDSPAVLRQPLSLEQKELWLQIDPYEKLIIYERPGLWPVDDFIERLDAVLKQIRQEENDERSNLLFIEPPSPMPPSMYRYIPGRTIALVHHIRSPTMWPVYFSEVA